MSSAAESAQLILKLFELRRDPLLREARAWFLKDFNPTNIDELLAVVQGDKNAWYRMVISYWDMSASLVTAGAINADMYRAANPEIVATFAKIDLFLHDIRRICGIPEFAQHIERVVREMDASKERLDLLRKQFRAAAEG